MLKQISLSALCALGLIGVSAFAEANVEVIETCKITQSLTLSRSTQILCDGDLKIDAKTVISTGPFSLQIFSVGSIEFGKHSKIVSTARAPQIVTLFARTAFGRLDVSSSVDVDMEFGSLAPDFQQRIELEYGAEVRAFVAGQLLPLEGPEHRIAR